MASPRIRTTSLKSQPIQVIQQVLRRTLRETADIQLAGARGAGVAELVEMICHDDARIIPPERHGLAVGALRDGRLTFIEPHCGSVLIAGRSGIGKSTLAIALTERMTEKGFEFCIFDPEGDYDGLDNAISLGDGKTPPQAEEALQLLQKAEVNITLNTQALDVAERPQFFAQLLPEVGWLGAERVGRIRSSSTRPTTCFHRRAAIFRNYCRKSSRRQSSLRFTPPSLGCAAHRGGRHCVGRAGVRSHRRILPSHRRASPVGHAAACRGRSVDLVPLPRRRAGAAAGHATEAGTPTPHPKICGGRCRRGPQLYFRGPEKALNLRAQNLQLFQQIADGIDDRTWEHHRRAGDYSRWFRDVIKNRELAEAAQAVEQDGSLDPKESRRRIGELVRRLYTAPAHGE